MPPTRLWWSPKFKNLKTNARKLKPSSWEPQWLSRSGSRVGLPGGKSSQWKIYRWCSKEQNWTKLWPQCKLRLTTSLQMHIQLLPRVIIVLWKLRSSLLNHFIPKKLNDKLQKIQDPKNLLKNMKKLISKYLTKSRKYLQKMRMPISIYQTQSTKMRRSKSRNKLEWWLPAITSAFNCTS